MKKLLLKNFIPQRHFLQGIFIIICIVFILNPISAHAEEKKIKFYPAVPFYDVPEGGIPVDGSSLGIYMESIYKFALGIVGILATIVMMWGGIRWITAGGSADAIGDAKSWIMASISGIVIAMSAFSILYFVNPDLVKFRPVTLPSVDGTKTITPDKPSSDCSVCSEFNDKSSECSACSAYGCKYLDESDRCIRESGTGQNSTAECSSPADCTCNSKRNNIPTCSEDGQCGCIQCETNNDCSSKCDTTWACNTQGNCSPCY